METIQKIIKQKKLRQICFFKLREQRFKGLNFHQGLDDLDYAKLSYPCNRLTTIYNNLVIKKFEKTYLRKN
jgi:hypothetical protein